MLPLRKSDTRTDRQAKMVLKAGETGVTLPTFVRRMLRAEEEIYAQRVIDGYPNKPILVRPLVARF